MRQDYRLSVEYCAGDELHGVLVSSVKIDLAWFADEPVDHYTVGIVVVADAHLVNQYTVADTLCTMSFHVLPSFDYSEYTLMYSIVK